MGSQNSSRSFSVARRSALVGRPLPDGRSAARGIAVSGTGGDRSSYERLGLGSGTAPCPKGHDFDHTDMPPLREGQHVAGS